MVITLKWFVMNWTPLKLKRLLNIYFPHLGAGVSTEYISKDWREARVSMKLRWYNRNAVGAHFGGSLYSMIDPHIMLMLMNILGKDYIVWDKAAEIDFIRPGTGTVTAEIKITDEMLADIKANTDSGDKYLPSYPVEILNESGELVCKVIKTIYIRKKNISS